MLHGKWRFSGLSCVQRLAVENDRRPAIKDSASPLLVSEKVRDRTDLGLSFLARGGTLVG